MSKELEWRIKIKIITKDGPHLIDQPLNDFPMQGMPTELAINVGSPDERQVIKHWHYFDLKVYLKPKETVPIVES
jgi:hypothetical protein